MAVYEVRNLTPLPRAGVSIEREDLRPVDGLAPIERIGRFVKEWARGKGQGYSRKEGALFPPVEGKEVRNMVADANERLQQQGILVHLVLMQGEDGLYIEVYDCTDEISCRVIHDIEIDISDLPTLMRNLYQESGLLVDTRT